MRYGTISCLLLVWTASAAIVAVTDGTNYNVGSEVRVRVEGAGGEAIAAIRYAGEDGPVVRDLSVAASGEYVKLWTIPAGAATGRYQVDINGVRDATSFAVHRKLVEVTRMEFDRSIYTSGDGLTCRVLVRNLTGRPLDGLRVEFGPWYFPWIAPPPDEPKVWTVSLADSLRLAPGAEETLSRDHVVTLRSGEKPAVAYYSVTIWDERREHVLDIAFSGPVFLHPPNAGSPKAYPWLYLYPSLSELSKHLAAYRHFYPPEFLSPVIHFDTSHTIFPSGARAEFRYHIDQVGMKVRARVLDASGKQVTGVEEAILGSTGEHHATIATLPDGRYVYEVSVVTPEGATLAANRIEFALDPLPKSILIFGAHEDDDTAHPATIRAAVENHIPIHLVYFTSGDAGGCDRYYMRSCDASRAMAFGEVRMDEARASLEHLGVPREDVYFLGLPDGGLEEIWLNHAKADNPYLSVLLAADHAPYADVVRPNLAYARGPVVDVVKEFIRRFQPDVILTGHPEERHVDHRTNNWLVVKAMQELLGEHAISPETRLLVDQSYGPASWIHSPYKYEKQVLYVPGEVARIGQEALWLYQSQDGNHQQGDLQTYAQLPREEVHYRIADWKKHEGWNERDLRGAGR